MRALICGGGVGGLSAAIALQRVGYEVIVFEKSEEMRTTGYGLNLWPNAVRALYELGLKESFDRISIDVNMYQTIDTNGEVLHEKDIRHWNEKYGAPSTGVQRKALTEMLARHAGFEHIKYGHELIGYEDDGTQILCHFSNGETIKGDFLIGADGIHSQVRQTMQGAIDYHVNDFHSYRWRGLVSVKDIEFDHRANLQVYGGDAFFGSIGIGDGKAYWYASGPGLDNRKSFNECFQSWAGSHVPHTLSVTNPENIMQTELLDLAYPPEYWTDGNVALLGDAVHPMMPDMAQGASQTFVDSLVLGQCMKEATPQTVRQQLKEYEMRRKPIANHVVDVARRSAAMRKKYFLVDRYEREVEGFKIR